MKTFIVSHDGVRSGLVIVILIQAMILTAIILLTTRNVVEIRAQGPLPILISVFLLPFMLVVLTLMMILFIKTSKVFKLIALLTVYVFKLLMPYVVFNGHVNPDTPFHYLSSLLLVSTGYSREYLYHNWPHSLILASAFRIVTELEYPLNSSVIAIIARMMVPLMIYIIGKNIFKLNNESLYIVLITLVIFEPFTMHFCPQIVAVSLALCCFMTLLRTAGMSTPPDIVTFHILFIALVFTHGMIPISISIYIVVLWLIKTLKGIYSSQASVSSTGRVATQLLLSTLLLVLIYNTFITVFVTRNVLQTLHLLFMGDIVRLDVYNVFIDEPYLQHQYAVIRFTNLVITSISFGPPAIYSSIRFILHFFKKDKYDIDEYLFTQLFTFVALNFLLFAILDMGFGIGLVERYYQTSVLVATLLLGIFYKNKLASSKALYLRTPSRVFSCSLIIMLAASIFTTPSFTTLFRWPYTPDELEVTSYVSRFSSGYSVMLTGDTKLAHQIFLERYLLGVHHVDVSYTNMMDINCLYQKYSYPEGTIILINELTIFKASDVPGLSLSLLKRCVRNFDDHLNRIYDNSYDQVYVR